MIYYGLVGKKLGHSYSKGYFMKKFEEGGIEGVYNNYELDDISKIREIVKNNKLLIGLNITVPYKVDVIKYIDEIDSEAKDVGAVNVVKIIREGDNIFLKGYNSDIYGFENSLLPLLSVDCKKAMILGTGGSSKAVSYVFRKLGIDYVFLSRFNVGDKIICYESQSESLIKNVQIIVNTTPLGMYPNINAKPDLLYDYIDSRHIFYDLIYNPSETVFLKEGRVRGAIVKNGEEMLKLQAERSWQIWSSEG